MEAGFCGGVGHIGTGGTGSMSGVENVSNTVVTSEWTAEPIGGSVNLSPTVPVIYYRIQWTSGWTNFGQPLFTAAYNDEDY